MRVSRIAASAAAAAVVVGGMTLATAPVASASGATVSITTDCNSDLDLHANVGDTVVINMTADCVSDGGVVWNINALNVSMTNSGFFGPATFENAGMNGSGDSYADDWYAYSDGSGTTRITTTLRATDGAGNALAVGSYLANIGFDHNGPYGIYYRGGTASDTPIPPWVQGYGRASAADLCLDGWTASWELWPHGGSGGWVCTREIPSLG